MHDQTPLQINAGCDVFSVGRQLLNPIRLAHFYRTETFTPSLSMDILLLSVSLGDNYIWL